MHHRVEGRIGIEAPLRGQGAVESLGQVFDRDLVVQRDVGAGAHIRVVEAEAAAQNLAPGGPRAALVRVTMDKNHWVGFGWYGFPARPASSTPSSSASTGLAHPYLPVDAAILSRSASP